MDIRRRRIVSLLSLFGPLGTIVNRIFPVSWIFVARSTAVSGILGNHAFAGQTTNIIIMGSNLSDTQSITFDQKDVTGRVLATHDSLVSVEVAVTADTLETLVGFTLHKRFENIHSATSNVYLAVNSPDRVNTVYGQRYNNQVYSPYLPKNGYQYQNQYGYCCTSFLGVGGDLL